MQSFLERVAFTSATIFLGTAVDIWLPLPPFMVLLFPPLITIFKLTQHAPTLRDQVFFVKMGIIIFCLKILFQQKLLRLSRN